MDLPRVGLIAPSRISTIKPAMQNIFLKLLSYGIFGGSLLRVCDALPQATTSAAPPSTTTIPWETKIDALREYVLQQPDQDAKKGRNGPLLQKTFADGECLEIRFLDWDCSFDIPYKMRGVAKWLDDINVRNEDPIWDPYRYYNYGYYVDPDNGWNFYGEARLSFGACGNRGPQSACGQQWCVDKDGHTVGVPQVPEGGNPYVDPNDRSNLCLWLRSNTTTVNTV